MPKWSIFACTQMSSTVPCHRRHGTTENFPLLCSTLLCSALLSAVLRAAQLLLQAEQVGKTGSPAKLVQHEMRASPLSRHAFPSVFVLKWRSPWLLQCHQQMVTFWSWLGGSIQVQSKALNLVNTSVRLKLVSKNFCNSLECLVLKVS